MNKFLSSLAAIALVITSVVISPVKAANIAASNILVNNSATASIAINTQITTVKFTPATALVNGNTITLIYDNNVADAGLVAGDVAVTDTDGGTYTVNSVTTATNKIVVTATAIGTLGTDQVTFTFSNSHLATPGAGAMLSFAFTTNSDIGANLIPVANYNQVSVSAVVDPTFTFTLTNNNGSLGSLSTSAFSATPVNIDLTYATNAKTGLTVSMASTGLKNGNTASDSEIGQTDINATVPNVASTYYRYTTGAGAGNAAAIALVTDGTAMGAANTVVPATGSPVSATTNVKANAEISALTPAGSYTDTLTFVATPTF